MFESMDDRLTSAPGSSPVAGDCSRLSVASVAERLAVTEDPSERLALIGELPPCALTLAYLAELDPRALDPHDRISYLSLWARHDCWFDAGTQRALVAVAGPAPAADDPRDDWAREDVALALRLATRTAGEHVMVARELHGRLARTGAALERGEITLLRARALADAVGLHDDDVARAVEAAALDGGHPDETLTNFRSRLKRLVIAADPRSADEQHLAAVAQRRVISWPEPHGMASVLATLTADEAATTMLALSALADHAKTHTGDDRPVDVRRADAFAALFHAALSDPRLPAAHRARPRVGVTVDLPTLAGLAEHPGHLDGYGPIPPVLARRLAADGDWHRLITDPVSGALLDYGTSVYRPPAELAEFLLARDRTCRFPTCNRAARHCDIDHAQPYPHERNAACHGCTSAHNCGALCRRNHRQKTDGNTRLLSHPDGSATWTTGTGHTYHRPAIDHCPEHTAYLKRLRAQAAADGAEPPVGDESMDTPRRTDSTADAGSMTGADKSAEPDDEPAHDANPPDGAIGRTASDAEHTDTGNDADRDATSGNDPPPF